MLGIALLIVDASIWVGVHVGISGTRLARQHRATHWRGTISRLVLAAPNPEPGAADRGVACDVDAAAVGFARLAALGAGRANAGGVRAVRHLGQSA